MLKKINFRFFTIPSIFLIMIFLMFYFAGYGQDILDVPEITTKWGLLADKNGVKIYLGELSASKFNVYKSVTTFEASLDEVISLALDVEGYKKWMTRCLRSRILLKESDDRYIYYLAVKTPWPFEDRDWVNRISVNRNSKTGVVTIRHRAIPGFYPTKDGFVRITDHQAAWFLLPIGKNKVLSVWQWHNNPEGLIPAWAIRLFAEGHILETTDNMKRLLVDLRKLH